MAKKDISIGILALFVAIASSFATIGNPLTVSYIKYRSLKFLNPEQCIDKPLACYPVTGICLGTGAICFASVTSSGLGGTVVAPIRVMTESCQITTNSSISPVVSLTDNCIVYIEYN